MIFVTSSDRSDPVQARLIACVSTRRSHLLGLNFARLSSMFRSSLGSYQHCGAQGTGNRHPGRYPQHRLITRDKCILDSLDSSPSPRVSRSRRTLPSSSSAGVRHGFGLAGRYICLPSIKLSKSTVWKSSYLRKDRSTFSSSLLYGLRRANICPVLAARLYRADVSSLLMHSQSAASASVTRWLIMARMCWSGPK